MAQTDGRLKVMQVALGTLGDEVTDRQYTASAVDALIDLTLGAKL